MARWTNEDVWNAEVQSAASRFGVPPELIKAVIGNESAFRPTAMRGEAALKDASIGLMQILFNTAKGEGYTGPVGEARLLSGLYDPATNITFGTSYLASQLARANGHVPSALSAYNGGWRPEIGFGALATRPLRICLARDKNAQCIQWRDVPAGEYSNQPYVNTVMGHYQYFLAKSPPPAVTSERPVSPLFVAHRYNNESENGGHSSGPAARSTWTQVWETLKRIAQWFFKRQRNN